LGVATAWQLDSPSFGSASVFALLAHQAGGDFDVFGDAQLGSVSFVFFFGSSFLSV
jgi:hypothetical protein